MDGRERQLLARGIATPWRRHKPPATAVHSANLHGRTRRPQYFEVFRSGSSSNGGGHILHSKLRPTPGQTQPDCDGAIYGRGSANTGAVGRQCLECFFACACRVPASAPTVAKKGAATSAVAQIVSVESRIADRFMGISP
jgi:hypothetical protein